ncbi:hypothetical protein JPSP44_24420 [Staphylococcus pseudintermedius]
MIKIYIIGQISKSTSINIGVFLFYIKLNLKNVVKNDRLKVKCFVQELIYLLRRGDKKLWLTT